MKPKIMDIDTDWERIKKEQLSFLDDVQNTGTSMNPVMMVGGKDAKETMLKTLVQQAARN